jgi:hypothetical protein
MFLTMRAAACLAVCALLSALLPLLLSQLLVNDNLDLGCTIIERAATDKAVRDIDKSLAQVRGRHLSALLRAADNVLCLGQLQASRGALRNFLPCLVLLHQLRTVCCFSEPATAVKLY